MLTFNPQNPLPLKQPFLTFHLKERDPWFVEVGGKIALYLNTSPEVKDSKLAERATPLLKEIARELANHGILITNVNLYIGSAGPSHVLRNGVFFERLSRLNRPVYEQPDMEWMAPPET